MLTLDQLVELRGGYNRCDNTWASLIDSHIEAHVALNAYRDGERRSNEPERRKKSRRKDSWGYLDKRGGSSGNVHIAGRRVERTRKNEADRRKR